MSVLDRTALEQSPLADLHTIASELSIDSYRRLRRDDLIDAIVTRQGGGEPLAEAEEEAESEVEEASETERALEGAMASDAETGGSSDDESAGEADAGGERDREPSGRRRRGRRGGRGRAGAPAEEERSDEQDEEVPAPEPEAEAPAVAEIVEGVVEILPNGSGFVRVSPPDPSDDDVYVSAAQVKRCELVSGDSVTGPRRTPRRSERFASMVRIDTINGRPAEELADTARFDELPAAFPNERFRLGSEDATLKAIEWLTPFGRGSRVTITGAPRAGKTEALRRLAATLSEHEDLHTFLVLAGVRPEELHGWPVEPAAAVSFAASSDLQGQTVERIVDQARRLAARGTHVAVLIDTLDGLQPPVARKLAASARNIADAGSLTVIATSTRPIGGETTVIALDGTLASTGRYPAVDLIASGVVRPDLLVGDAGAEAIARAREEALSQ